MNREIAINNLVFSSDNVRTVNVLASADKELIASIRANGILQNLIVKTDVKGKYEVIAGGRRLAALNHLLKAKEFKKTDKISCLVVENENYAEISLTENVNRVAMHPADEFLAYQKMLDQGATLKDIACRFGVSQNVVKRRLKLANVSSVIMDAFKANKLSLECVMAFTVCDDHEQQNACYKAIPVNRLSSYSIKEFLLSSSVSSTEPMVIYVGLKQYKKSGGAVTVDMFSNQIHLLNKALLMTLAEEKLNNEKTALLKQDWKWVDVQLERSPSLLGYHIVQAVPVNVPSKLDAEILALSTRFDELDGMDDELWTDKDGDEYTELDAKIENLKIRREEYAIFSDEDKSMSGCIVYINSDGKLGIHKGLARPADLKKIKSEKEPETSDNEVDGCENNVDVYPQSLKQDIRLYKQQMIKAKLAGNVNYCRDLMMYTLCRKMFLTEWFLGSIDIQFRVSDRPTKLDDLNETVAGQILSDYYSQLNLSFLRIESSIVSFTVFQSLSEDDKNAIFSFVTASMFTLSDENIDTQVVKDLQLDFVQMWRPTADNFFSRLKRDKLLSLGKLWLGDEWAEENEKRKKTELSASLNSVFQGNEKLNDELVKVREQWLPDGFYPNKV